ncbi:UbiA prenyltransferase family protein [Lacinutrix jangbogonensis]|uniref:membrane protein n=1 Tax=Lacinutrix jangbogonensis TaxID=1469557 RepID=UPI00053F0442|nr:membrane protein [Lacinutrix jangbogonensis]
MRIIKQLFDFYLNSSIHVALAVCALSWITLNQFNIFYDENILYFIFFATITGYNFVKYFGIAKFHHRSLTDALRIIQVFSLICFVLLCYYAIHLQLKTLISIAVFGIITFLYAIPFIPKNFYLDNQQNLRDVSGLKVYVIALVWAGVTVFLPLINNDFSINTDVYITTFQRFVFVIVLMLPFEIRDLDFDSLKLATIPQKIGVKYTKIFGLFLLVLLFFAEFLKDELSHGSIIMTLLISLITLSFLVLSNKKRNCYYSSFWVESIPIIWLLIILFC